MTRNLAHLFVVFALSLLPRIAFALITGGEGNEKLNESSALPKGAIAIINRPDRIAWWEGDGGPFNADGRGNTEAIRQIVADFAKIDVQTKQIVVRDGIGQSYFLNMDLHDELKQTAEIDGNFSVWPEGKWESSLWLYTAVRPNRQPPVKPDLPAQLNIYTANIRWDEVVVPVGIKVIDERLKVHGYSAADGNVFEGQIKALPDGPPPAATIHVQRLDRNSGHGVIYTNRIDAKSDTKGAWVVKGVPAAWVRVVVVADGFAPRIIGYARCYDKLQWRSFDCELARAVSITGRVTDQSGTPLAGVEVRLDGAVIETDDPYESPGEFKFKTDAEGRFRLDNVPAGKATVWLHKSGYSMGGLGKLVTLPASDLELQMLRAGTVRVTVDFGKQKRPADYMVELEPEGGNAVGKYGGSATIDAENKFTFENVPPGKYVIKGHPNPYSEREVTEPLKIDLKEANAADVTINVKPVDNH